MTEKRHIDPERAANRRRQVLDAAATCFRRSGFHGASMSEISKAAGMSAGHIYNYFASKDAIIAAFVEENETRVMGIISDIGSQPDPLQAIIDDVDQSIRDNLDPDYWALPLEIAAESARNPAIAALSQGRTAACASASWPCSKPAAQSMAWLPMTPPSKAACRP